MTAVEGRAAAAPAVGPKSPVNDNKQQSWGSSVLSFLVTANEALHRTAEKVKGLQALAKLFRTVETIVKATPQGLNNVSKPTANTLKIIGGASAALSAASIIINIPEIIEKSKEIVRVAKEVLSGNTESLTTRLGLAQSGFWLKQLASVIESVTYAGNTLQFYVLGSTAATMGLVKSFADGISSLLTVIEKSMAVFNARIKCELAAASVKKWEARAAWVRSDRTSLDPNGWDLQGLEKTYTKELLKAHNTFLNDLLTSDKLKISAENRNTLLEQQELIKTTLFRAKMEKILGKDSLDIGQADQQSRLDRIKDKAWVAKKLTPSSRKAILDVLNDKVLTPEAKIRRLINQDSRDQPLKYNTVKNAQLAFGAYDPIKLSGRQISDSMLASEDAYSGIASKFELKRNTWIAYTPLPQARLDKGVEIEGFASDPLDHKVPQDRLAEYCDRKVTQWKEEEVKQTKIIRRSASSIAFSVGIIAMVALGLTLNFTAGKLSPGVMKNLPYITASLGGVVSIVGLIKFFMDEFQKEKNATEAKITNFPDPWSAKRTYQIVNSATNSTDISVKNNYLARKQRHDDRLAAAQLAKIAAAQQAVVV